MFPTQRGSALPSPLQRVGGGEVTAGAGHLLFDGTSARTLSITEQLFTRGATVQLIRPGAVCIRSE